jgi:excisionase family DNA binding protein
VSETSNETQEWLSIGEAAQRLGVHIATLRRWADNGEIAYTLTPGGHRRFSKADLVEFSERQRRLSRPSGLEQNLVETAITKTRSQLAEHQGERWLGENGGWREKHRKIGRQLMGLTMQFISADEEDAEPLIAEARNIGRRYARISLQGGLPLAEVLSASMFFRDMLVETAIQTPDSVRVRPESNLRLLRKINFLLNIVLITIAEEYDAFNNGILSRD